MADETQTQDLRKVVSDRSERVYAAKDHLLVVEGHYALRLRRFFYRDIQAIFYRTTTRWIVTSILAGCALVFFLALTAFNPEIWPVLLIFGLPLAAFLIFDLVSGPTTECYIQSAVQRHQLASCSRRRKAHKVITALEPHIRENQPNLSEAEFKQRIRDIVAEAREYQRQQSQSSKLPERGSRSGNPWVGSTFQQPTPAPVPEQTPPPPPPQNPQQ